MKKTILTILTIMLIVLLGVNAHAAQIDFNKSTITMNKSEKIKIEKIDDNITGFKILNQKIATVKDNQIVGIKKGTTTITFIKANNEEITFKLNIKQPVKKIRIKTKTKSLKIGSSTKLQATISPNNASNKKVTWKSSNEKIATVNSKGKVTAKNPGTVTITATSKDGKVKSSIKITVKEKYTKEELRYMAAIIYSEAGNQCYAGKKAVGIVVMNRKESKVWPNTIKDVLYQSGQFTPAYNGSLNYSLSLYDDGKLDKDCIKAAKEVLNGSKTVTYNKKEINMKDYYYFSGYVANKRLTIQDHQFK